MCCVDINFFKDYLIILELFCPALQEVFSLQATTTSSSKSNAVHLVY